MIALSELNAADEARFVSTLGGIFEHSPWVPRGIAGLRPFASVRALHAAMAAAVLAADDATQLALIRAHPELAGRAAVRGELTPESTREQAGAGLSQCSAEEYAALHELNATYGRRFGFPFILAVKGHTPASVIEALRTRVAHDLASEQRVAIEQICRIARFRVVDLVEEPLGDEILSMHAELAELSEQADGLTCTYLTPVHRQTAARIRDFMLGAGLEVELDAVGNVVGRMRGSDPAAATVITGSHFDTVIDAGRFDGRLGILLPIAVVARLRRAGRAVPFPLEIAAFAEEEGVRFRSTFLGSRALAGRFDPALLDLRDDAGLTLRDALAAAGLDAAAIPSLARRADQVRAFVEVHIEQGPVLLAEGRAVGVVTGIAGCTRWGIGIQGTAGHAGTVPMHLRHDAAAGAAEFVLAVEHRCRAEPDLVGTVGKLAVPGGAINVIAGRAELGLDVRSGDDTRRKAALDDLSARLEAIAATRGLRFDVTPLHDVATVPCDPRLMAALATATERVTGVPARRLPSGAGHDAMMMAHLAPVAMLFVRCGNDGVSHSPAETLTAADAETAARVFEEFLFLLSAEAP